MSENEKRWVCAHELGHMLLHKKSNAVFMDTKTHFNTNIYEIEADKFAVELLVSDEDVLALHGYTIQQAARILGYQKRLIELKWLK